MSFPWMARAWIAASVVALMTIAIGNHQAGTEAVVCVGISSLHARCDYLASDYLALLIERVRG